MLDSTFVGMIAEEVKARAAQVETAINLFTGGATIPFIARYRKDATGNLDEVALETIWDRYQYFNAVTQRRKAILENIEKQGKLTPELRAAIEACTNKQRLEDLYLPFKRQRKTRAAAARERGLTPLADYLLTQEHDDNFDEFVNGFVSEEKGVPTPEAALSGARDIIAERVSVNSDIRTNLRDRMLKEGRFVAAATKVSEGKKTKFSAYYNFSEPLNAIPPHRFLAIIRGQKEGLLRTELQLDDSAVLDAIKQQYVRADGDAKLRAQVEQAIDEGYQRLLRPSIETEVLGLIRDRADEESIGVFRANAEALLMAPPAGQVPILGVDPGIRTGCKAAVIDSTGTYKAHALFFPEQTEEAVKQLETLMKEHGVRVVAVGNGTGSREAARLVKQVLSNWEGENKPGFVIVNESGASFYSVSETAREEFGELDATIRGAISIARRLQDPLAELVKLEPRNIGVGQYQHDVHQKKLREGLHRTVVSCVNQVGVDLNTASVPLLRYVSGIHFGTAQNLVAHRNQLGGFKKREQLLEVGGIGTKVYEQCAGFLRIANGDQLLDSTAIHPEAYPVVEQAAQEASIPLPELIKNREAIEKIEWRKFASDTVGETALDDIRRELLKPGRDPRKEFRVPEFAEGVDDVKDLTEGTECEGVVTNVTDFGAFVDIGVHQDGLVHLSELANAYVHDPRTVVKVGEIVRVKVIGVDKDAPRISLSIKALQPAPERRGPRNARRSSGKPDSRSRGPAQERAGATASPQGAQRGEEKRDPRASRKRKRERPNGRKPDRKQQRSTPEPAQPLNTQLADQLAALKRQLASEE